MLDKKSKLYILIISFLIIAMLFYFFPAISTTMLVITIFLYWYISHFLSSDLYIKQFVNLYIDNTSFWPIIEIQISKEDIKAYKKILFKEKRIWLPIFILHIKVNNKLEQAILENFEKFFKDRNPDFKKSNSLKILAKEYVETFGNNFSYSEITLQIVKNYNSVEKFEKLLQKEIKNHAIQCRMKNISDALENNGLLTGMINEQDIDILSGVEFENFLAKLFTSMGYEVLTTKVTGDQGADLILTKFGANTVVQAKRYTGRVSNSAVQEVVAAKAMYDCTKAIVVTNSYFTKSASDLANQIKLILLIEINF